MAELGQLPHAPIRRNRTTPSSSTSISSTSPPSLNRYGRNLLNTSCTSSFISAIPFLCWQIRKYRNFLLHYATKLFIGEICQMTSFPRNLVTYRITISCYNISSLLMYHDFRFILPCFYAFVNEN